MRVTRQVRGTSRAAVSVLLAAAVLMAGTVTVRPLPAARAASAPTGARTACAYTSHSISALQRLSALVGRDIDCAVVFTDSTDSWSAWASPWILNGVPADSQWDDWYHAVPGRTLVVTQSLVPKDIPGDWRALGAAGAFDDDIRAWTTAMVADGLGSVIVRLGHEANGDWYFDDIGDTPTDHASWAAYWARFVRVTRTVAGAHFTFDWTVNAGYRRIAFDAYYPGDDVVDVIGIDQYDGPAYAPPTPTVPPADRWNQMLTAQDGIGDLMAYATAHHKPLSIPEWGLTTPDFNGGNGGGDDGYFVDRVADIVRTHDVAYSGVWEMNTPTSPVALENNPQALAAYRAHFGAGGDSLPGSGTGTPAVAPPVVPPPVVAPPPVTPPAVAPPAAAPAPSTRPVKPLATTLSAHLAARVVKVGHRLQILATLTRAGRPVGSAPIVVERLVKRRWTKVVALHSGRTGKISWTHKATASAAYRLRFAGSVGSAASHSRTLTLTVRR